MDLHPNCEPVRFLLGTWKGAGAGSYPTIEPFQYLEEVSFGHVGKPFLAYSQKTRDADTGEPLHAETGYLRVDAAGGLEFVLVQPSGIIEIHNGDVSGTRLDLNLVSVHGSPTAKSVTDVSRRFALTGQDTLDYTLDMAAVGQPMTHHLQASLHRET